MDSDSLGEFDALFKRSVPHILEKILFSLDYDSFSACGKVCKVWNDLLSSESYMRKSCELLLEKVDSTMKRGCVKFQRKVMSKKLLDFFQVE